MEMWDEFVAAVERGEAERQDAGGQYDIPGAILRALHSRVAALESRLPEPEPAEQAPAE